MVRKPVAGKGKVVFCFLTFASGFTSDAFLRVEEMFVQSNDTAVWSHLHLHRITPGNDTLFILMFSWKLESLAWSITLGWSYLVGGQVDFRTSTLYMASSLNPHVKRFIEAKKMNLEYIFTSQSLFLLNLKSNCPFPLK